MKTLNRFLAQNNSLNFCFITGWCTSTKERVGRGTDSFLGDTQKTQDLVIELVSATETTQSDQDTANLSLWQINILLLRVLRAAWLPGSPTKENGKHHCTYSLQQQCTLWDTTGISSPFSDAAILGEWQGNSPLGCSLLLVSSHMTVVTITNVPLKLMLGFYSSWYLTHSLANPEKLQREKVTICQSFSPSCLP